MSTNSLLGKVAPSLRQRLEQVDPEARISIEIVPLQNRWEGLLHHLKTSGSPGVEYNVIDLTSIAATLPKRLIESLADRRDVVAMRIREDDQ